MSIQNEIAALGVGAQHGDRSKGCLRGETEGYAYRVGSAASIVRQFRPRGDVILIEYAVTHWRVSRIHAGSGTHTVLGCAGTIVTAAAYARSTARRYAARIVLSREAAGWRHLLREAA